MNKSKCCDWITSTVAGETVEFVCCSCWKKCELIWDTSNISVINRRIKEYSDAGTLDTDEVSDWYHTFWELYAHRIALFIALCKQSVELEDESIKEYSESLWYSCIKSRKHFDWEWYDWYFIVQLETPHGQISYHMIDSYWDNCDFAETQDKANEWDGHTADDVLKRLLLI